MTLLREIGKDRPCFVKLSLKIGDLRLEGRDLRITRCQFGVNKLVNGVA